MNNESGIYLQNIAHKIELYNETKQKAVDFCIKNKIKEKSKIQNALIMSQLWLAKQIGETLTIRDLLILLGGDEEDIGDNYEIEQSIEDVSLEEILKISIGGKDDKS